MKYILQVPASLDIGGVEKVARDIGLYSDITKYTVHYIVFGDKKGAYEDSLIAHGCKIFHLQEPSVNYIRFLHDLKIIMSNTKYDIIHAHTMFNIGWIMMVADRMKVPVRVAHSHSALINNGGIKVKIYEKIMRYLILKKTTDYIACGEKAGIRLFGEKTHREKTNLILNGIDVEKFKYSLERRATVRKRLNLEKCFVIGHVGHLAKVKNQIFLIKLMPEILKCRPEARLLLLGEGPDHQMLTEEICKLRLQEFVIMTGNVPDVYGYLSAMDVFAFPSLFEGMPLSIIEVQANGLPCVLSSYVPEDVYLTDLVHPLTLNDPALWVELICLSNRGNSDTYADFLKESGFDTQSVMKKIYDIYERRL